MSGLTIGSLCSGYGGLDRAVEDFFGAQTAWFAEYEAAPSRILAAHWPGVPNFGDMTAIDWASVPKVDIVTGGTPCQDLSGAGKRRGMTEGTRSNLWVQMRECIAVVRPSVVVWENVRGAYSACAESEIDSELGRCPRCVDADSGAGHAPNLRALHRVLGDLSELGFDAEWVGLRASDAGAPHERFRVFVVAFRRGVDFTGWGRPERPVLTADEATLHLLKTPTSQLAVNGGSQHPEKRKGGGHGPTLADEVEHLLPTVVAAEGTKGSATQGVARKAQTGQVWLTNVAHDLQRPDALLPTPNAMASNDGEGPETWLARRERVKLTAQNGNGMGMPLAIAAQLLPGIVQDDLAKPSSTGSVAEYEALWASLDDQSPFWVTADGVDYWPAIERWTRVMGRPAPSPTLPDGKGGKHRLNARLAEWMMGQADGHITSPALGLSRNEQLKACGNGVVTQQAALALSIAWGRVLEAVDA